MEYDALPREQTQMPTNVEYVCCATTMPTMKCSVDKNAAKVADAMAAAFCDGRAEARSRLPPAQDRLVLSQTQINACAHLRRTHEHLHAKHAIHAQGNASSLDTPRGAIPSGAHQLSCQGIGGARERDWDGHDFSLPGHDGEGVAFLLRAEHSGRWHWSGSLTLAQLSKQGLEPSWTHFWQTWQAKIISPSSTGSKVLSPARPIPAGT